MDDTLIQTQLHAAVASYVMPTQARDIINSGEVLVICGVTAAGKNAVSDYLVSHGNFAHVVSHTTREPRENHGVLEQNGREYWFVEPAQMLQMIHEQRFIEAKAIHGSTCYGTSIQAVEYVMQMGKRPIMEIDVQGVLDLMSAAPKLQPLFILPPSYEVWMERLGTRGNISDGEKERRLRSASMELETALDHLNFIFIVNEEKELTAAEIIRGVDSSTYTQSQNRTLAKELLETIRNS